VTQAASIRNVAKRLRDHQALDNVSLDVMRGEALVVLGPSGSGKTTLLRLLAGLEIPDTGGIWLSGVQVSARGRILVPPHERRIGYVFQDLALWPHLTVHQHMDFVLGSLHVPRPDRASRIAEILTLVRIERLATRYPHELSGGEQQRVALARAFVGDPQLILMDEPFSSLDDELRARLREELAELQRSAQITTVYVTHDREDARLADRLVEIRAGRISS